MLFWDGGRSVRTNDIILISDRMVSDYINRRVNNLIP